MLIRESAVISVQSLLRPLSFRKDVRRHLIELFAKYLTREMKVYDIGCGRKPYTSFMEGRVKSYLGVDLDDGFYNNSDVDIIGSALEVPVSDGEADAVISSQVIEHLEKPGAAVKESYRLLAEGGLLFLSCPFLYPIHAPPRDYFRYTEFGVEEILRDSGFRVLERRVVGGFWYCVGFFLGLYLRPLDTGILRKMRIIQLMVWMVQSGCALLNWLEAGILRLLRREVSEYRRMWAMNYVYVAVKDSHCMGSAR